MWSTGWRTPVSSIPAGQASTSTRVVLLGKLKAGVDDGMGDDAARVGLVGEVEELEFLAEAVGRGGDIGRRGKDIGEAARALEYLLVAGHAGAGEEGGLYPDTGRVAGHQRRRAAAMHDADAGGLRHSNADCPDRLALGKLHQLCRGDR